MKIKTPVIVLNLKSYQESSGERGLLLAKACEEVTKETGISTIICPQQIDVALVSANVKIPVLAQHVDSFEPGSFTGYIALESIKACGGKGTLLNHSENPMKIIDIDRVIRKANKLDLITIACSNNIQVSKSLAEMSPTSVAIEPPDLIGSGIPVSKANPDVVLNSVDAVKAIRSKILVLCGAGISTGKDLKAALDLGADGVLLASGVVKSVNPKAALTDLALGVS
jgi:triosephosphate isomerase|tara:strand:+ start:811 stop:1488 length:678 start_codon:yes stop_codon:yes gene_type:complete